MKLAKTLNQITVKSLFNYVPYVIIVFFFIAYSILGIIKHHHFLSGYDLAVIDQGIWKYSQFITPITTVHAYPDSPIYADHVEWIFLLIALLYWIFDSVILLIVLQVLAVCASAVAVYLLARKKHINLFVAIALLISYLMFYGIQNALGSDVHSLVFAIGFLAWFIYCLEVQKLKLAAVFFLLALICKEDIGLFTFLISFIYFIQTRRKVAILFMLMSIIYVGFVFLVYFPYFTEGYRFQNNAGLLSNIDIRNLYNTQEKQDVLKYSVAWFGFLPLLAPLYLILPLGDLAHYFLLGSNYVTSAQGMFMHYRSTLALFMVWPAIMVIPRYEKLNNKYLALYLIFFAFLFQYILHLPLSYLSKNWFWTPPSGAQNVRYMLVEIPHDATLATQVNISPHVTHRNQVYTIWPENKHFQKDSPCGLESCHWFRWHNNPQYLLVDLSPEWDTRHLLTNNDDFRMAIKNLETKKVISEKKKIGSTVLYQIHQNPSTVK